MKNYEVSFRLNGVYCANIVRASNEATAKEWFIRSELAGYDSQFVGIRETDSEPKPGEPVHKAVMYDLSGIIFDTEKNGETVSQAELGLPSEVAVSAKEIQTSGSVKDWLSDAYGYCVKSFICERRS